MNFFSWILRTNHTRNIPHTNSRIIMLKFASNLTLMPHFTQQNHKHIYQLHIYPKIFLYTHSTAPIYPIFTLFFDNNRFTTVVCFLFHPSKQLTISLKFNPVLNTLFHHLSISIHFTSCTFFS